MNMTLSTICICL